MTISNWFVVPPLMGPYGVYWDVHSSFCFLLDLQQMVQKWFWPSLWNAEILRQENYQHRRSSYFTTCDLCQIYSHGVTGGIMWYHSIRGAVIFYYSYSLLQPKVSTANLPSIAAWSLVNSWNPKIHQMGWHRMTPVSTAAWLSGWPGWVGPTKLLPCADAQWMAPFERSSWWWLFCL